MAWGPSRQIGGSPGRLEPQTDSPLDSVRINEFLAHTDLPSVDFVELYNHNPTPLDLSGCVLTDNPQKSRFVIPAGTVIPAGGFFVFNENQLGFALDARGEAIFLIHPQRNRILDAVRFGAQANGVATGRYPDGETSLHELLEPTPGKANAALLQRQVVINEVLYNPISGDNEDEFVELYNPSAEAISLGGWRLVDGIDFTFPEEAVLPAKSYAVVTRNASRFLLQHTNLDASVVWGNFGGSLANDGERLALAMPQWMTVTNADQTITPFRAYVTVDEVTYGEGGRWGRWSDGGGSSLELVDARADNRQAANWADSDETAKAAWTPVEATGLLDHGMDDYGINTLQVILMNEGECLVDNVEVIGPGGQNLVANSTFEGGVSDLLFRGTHKQSTLQNGGGINNSRCLHIRASARGDTGPNQVTLPLTTALTPGTMVTLRAQVRWLKGNPEVLLRLRGNFLEAAGHLNLPENPGTPGARNSRTVINIGPAIYQVQHNPILPQAGQPVLVTARAQDPDGVASMVLQYRYDPAVTVHRVVMLDNGTAGDRIAGDGVYSGLIPGQPAGTLIAFSIQARDGFVPAAIAMFPQDAPVRECLVRYGEVQPIGNFGTYRIWFTQATADEWSSRERGSNEPLDATFVYGNSRVIYNMGALYSGSPWHWTGYNSPTGSLCNYQLIMPADDLFLGTTDFVLNAPSNLGSDRTGIRERLTHFMAEQIGLPSTYRRFVHCYVNGLRRSFIFEDVQQPSREFVEQWYPDNAEGELFKIEDWFEYNDEAQGFSNIDATLDNFTTLNGRKKLERYRWMWRKRAVRDSAHDYQRLFDLVDAVNTQDPDHYTQAVHSQVDIEQWMKTMAVRHAVGDWDSYGYQRGKNMFAYRDANLRWVLMNWDISFALGLGDGPGHDVFDTTHSDNITIDQITDRMFKHPPFRRLYLQALAELAKKSFSPGPAIDYMTAHNQALANNSITVESLSSVNAWINSRRAYLDRVISTNQADFEVVYEPIPANPQDKNLVRLRGSAPLEVKTLEVNGIPVALDWNTTTAWTLALPVQGGANLLEIRGIDGSGNVVAGSTTNLTIEYPGLAEKPQDRLVINEIMYEAEIPEAEFVEVHNLSSTYFFDLSDFYFDGVDFTFPPGSLISPQGYLLIVQNRQVFEALYGANLPIAGQFSGRLNNAGEILRLYQPGGTTDSPILIDEVTYASQPPWPVQADTTGSSLQLQDPTQDNNRVGNWTAVDTNGMAPPRWQYVSLTGKPAASNIDLSLNGPGQVYIDHLILVKGLIPESGANLIRDGEFELPYGSHWQATEDHAGSDTVHSPRYSGDLCLRLTALGPNGAVRQSLQQALDPNEFYSLSYWYLPGQGTAMASVGIEGLGLTSTHSVQPELAARRTPGTANSVRKTLGPLPTLWLNEVLSENTRGLPDAAGEREPWIELFNSGIRPVNLEGFYLSSSFSDLSLWEFPAGTLIQPGQFLVVIADGQSTQSIPGQPHTSFRLSPVAGQLALSRLQNGNLVVVDYLEYASQAPNQSYGCYPDGQSHNRFVFASPTPGASNLEVADVPAVRINEWMADNTGTIADPADGGFEDWIEIHNGGVGAIDLGGYSLTDDLGNPTKWSFPDGTLLAPNGLLLIWADEETEQNDLGLGLHVNFKLSRGGEEIGLFDPRGNRVDSVEFGMQATDISEGRFPDGSDHIRSLQEPSPGKSNGGGEGELRVDRIAVSPAGVTLFFTTTPGRTYVVQHKDEITAPNWINLADPFVAVSTETSATDPLPQSSTQRYYRVLEIQP
ncbi:MAG TPA: lamin tail domain-containing protein [Verrucomicrobiota bacterium]|nr:lamin tail domain-containing protein [Verrucomicrobiota bacterium]